jgi:hypothetical protein
LVATKLRALYQRSKGRDLLDIWLALTVLQLDPDRIIKAFAPYRPDGYTAALAIKSLRNKLDNPTFKEDTNNLVSEKIEGYDVVAAGEMVIEALLAKS